MLYLVIFLILFVNLSAIAEVSISSDDLLAFATKQAKQLQGQANKLIEQGDLFAEEKPKKGCPSQLLGNTGNCTNKKAKEKSSKILVFVSFSLPESSLKTLAQEAETYNGILVMRGLYQDSFPKTAQKLKDLGVTVDIHPDLFEKHHITTVPTFLQIEEDKAIHRLSGNVTLSFCAEKFGETS